MNHAKACKKRKSLKGPWARAKKTGRFGCPAGQFHRGSPTGGSCYICPKQYVRIHAAGADTGKCAPMEPCKPGLLLAKQPSKNVFDSLLELPKGKVCAPLFDIKVAARQEMPTFKSISDPLVTLAEDALRVKNKDQLVEFLKSKNTHAVLRTLSILPGFGPALEIAKENGFETLTIGWGSDAQLGFGGNSEIGIGINTHDPRLVAVYESVGFSKGVAAGIDSVLSVGLWKGPFEDGHSQGVTASISGKVIVGGGVWFSYFSPTEGQQRLVGLTVSAGIGLGF